MRDSDDVFIERFSDDGGAIRLVAAAQSREPVPYSYPAKIINGVFCSFNRRRSSYFVASFVKPRFFSDHQILMRTLAKLCRAASRVVAASGAMGIEIFNYAALLRIESAGEVG